MDRIRNENIRGTATVEKLGNTVRGGRLRRFGHVQRKDSGYTGRMMLQGKRHRTRPKMRFMDVVNVQYMRRELLG